MRREVYTVNASVTEAATMTPSAFRDWLSENVAPTPRRKMRDGAVLAETTETRAHKAGSERLKRFERDVETLVDDYRFAQLGNPFHRGIAETDGVVIATMRALYSPILGRDQ